MGGIERKQAQEGQQWGEELASNRWRERRKKTPFYSLPRIHPLEPVGSPPTTVVPQLSSVPTTARNRELAVVVTVLGCGSTVARYYRTWCGTTAGTVLPRSTRYYRPSRTREPRPHN